MCHSEYGVYNLVGDDIHTYTYIYTYVDIFRLRDVCRAEVVLNLVLAETVWN